MLSIKIKLMYLSFYIQISTCIELTYERLFENFLEAYVLINIPTTKWFMLKARLSSASRNTQGHKRKRKRNTL